MEDPRPVGCADGDDRVRGVLQWGAANYHGKEGAKTGGVGDIAARNDGGGGASDFLGRPGEGVARGGARVRADVASIFMERLLSFAGAAASDSAAA